MVTANKALLAKHGSELAGLAEQHGVALNFEAAVAGGIPVIKTLREALAGNQIRRVYGILNGTCNYILTQMQEEHRAFAEVLKEAQDKGYAEADPTFDIGGFDTAHKLALLTSLAFGTKVALRAYPRRRHRRHHPGRHRSRRRSGLSHQAAGRGFADRQRHRAARASRYGSQAFGYRRGVGGDQLHCHRRGFRRQRAVGRTRRRRQGDSQRRRCDILDIARGGFVAPFGVPAARLKPYRRARLGQHQGAYYVRLSVFDRPGAMASIAGRMGERGVSLESIVQRRPRWALPGIDAKPKAGAPTGVILMTHETTEEAIRLALKAIHGDGNVSEQPQMIRIEPL